ncbi:MAG: hypothetical protein IJ381_08375 [Clostridia bacterium]|nr:hypothetical protein [Clostridia bacterium]MBQ7982640.1 hypothetical protein [Clostridia bacterium]
MTHIQAMTAMDTGERVRYRDTKCIVVGILRQRKIAYNEYRPYCVGDFYYTARVMEAESKAPCIMDVRPEDLRTEEEYLQEIKKREKDG